MFKVEIVEGFEFKCLRVKEGDIILLEISHGEGDCRLTMSLNKGDEYFLDVLHNVCELMFHGDQEDLEYLAEIMEEYHLSRFADAIREMVMPTREVVLSTSDY